MIDEGTAGLVLIVINVIVSYNGFTNRTFFDAYKFEVDSILINKEVRRIITAGFLHVGWKHLFFNMFSLYAFSVMMHTDLGAARFLVIYFSALIGGDVLALIVHKQHGDYSAVGASGAVCGIIFASIALYPGMGIGIFLLPFSIPGWLYGILYVLYSMYGIKSKRDNIGHEAHLGGALAGMLVALLLQPAAFAENYFTILCIAIPSLAFIWIVINKPHFLLIDNFFFDRHKDYYSIDQKYNDALVINQHEVDAILEKISSKGMNSLSSKEKEKLKRYSKTIR